MKLTQAALASLRLPEGVNDRAFSIDDTPGFAVRLRRNREGKVKATFTFQYRFGKKQGRPVFGPATPATIPAARAWAMALYVKTKGGVDPVAERAAAVAKAGETVGACLELFLAQRAKTLRPRSLVEMRRHLLVHCRPLHRLPIADVDRRTVALLLNKLAETSGPVAANLTRSALSTFMVWAMKQGLVDTNPVVATNKNPTQSRERTLTDDELRAIWLALDDGPDDYSALVRLLILTAARRQELGGLTWSECDLDAELIHLPRERMKQKRAFDLPLSPPAVAILKARPRHPDHDFVFGTKIGFQTWSWAKRQLDERLTIAPWRLHDLRRTAATRMAEKIKILPHVIEEVLGHARPGIAAVYNKSTYLPEKADALVRWAEYVSALAEGRPSKVVSLRA
jgi:integrase